MRHPPPKPGTFDAHANQIVHCRDSRQWNDRALATLSAIKARGKLQPSESAPATLAENNARCGSVLIKPGDAIPAQPTTARND